jgi:hypothetical protein
MPTVFKQKLLKVVVLYLQITEEYLKKVIKAKTQISEKKQT